MNTRITLDTAIKRVVDAGNCSGCGACALLDPGISMALDDQGYLRPVRLPLSKQEHEQEDQPSVKAAFRAACPGIRVKAPHPSGSRRHPQLGPVVEAWEAWATDPEIRHAGSSGGTLSALSGWLVDTGQASRITAAAADPENARRTVPVQIISKEQALAAAGSRYAPVGNVAAVGALDSATAFVGKPCEVSALRVLGERQADVQDQPILMSFFCAGTPSQLATEKLAADLGIGPDEQLSELRYRGKGWPGDFSITRSDGSVRTASYDESWGKYLGPTTQWRCKICPDGVGESADITAGDYWRTDAKGYPIFSESAGISALIARTQRGRTLVLAAADAGVLTLRALELQELVAVQPLQRKRRETLLARLIGAVAAGGKVPHYSGFSLLVLAAPRLRESVRTARESYRRSKSIRSRIGRSKAGHGNH